VSLPAAVTIVEVGPRDGLQNEPASLPVDARVALVDALSDAGLPVIEVGAFVSRKWVPQMAATDEVCARIRRRPGTRYTALVPNLTGLDRASAAGLADVAVFAAASETFSRRNINRSIDESLEIYREVCRAAGARGMRVRGYLSTCFGCPYEGAVPAARVADLSARLLDMGVDQVSVSDTIGVAHPAQVHEVLDAVLARVPLDRVALHFHDTRGTALANVYAGLLRGVTTFDASCGGLGGCPYAPGASGNLATEDLVYVLDGFGIRSGVRIDAVMAASTAVAAALGRPLASRYVQAVRAAATRS
jgi:hydroxymethylglutaryl-CoA lyase